MEVYNGGFEGYVKCYNCGTTLNERLARFLLYEIYRGVWE